MRRARMVGAAGAAMAMLAGVVPAAGSQDEAPAAIASFADARGLLDALETGADDLRTLRASIQYDRRFLLQGDQHVRRGTLYFAQREREDGAGLKRVFEVDFTVLYLVGGDTRRKEDDRQVWTFNGEWLVEKRPEKKQYIARQVAPPGADFDPLRLGEGPIPIPLGQEAEAVLARYDATLVPTAEGIDPAEDPKLIEFAERDGGSWQLRLVPRVEDDDFEEIRLWYAKGTLLPRMAMTTNRSGDVSVVQLLQVEQNIELPPEVFSVTPPPMGQGWDTQIEEYRGE
ncbi:MAG: outer membrane lipoprotein carrier protein LolA [Phycisphaerales bacterium]